jgi:hypothetical protein
MRPASLALPELNKRHAGSRLVWHPFWHPTVRQIVRLIAQSVIHEIRVGVIAEAERKLTRRCCGLLLDYGFLVNVLTKSTLVLRDLDLLSRRNARNGNWVFTIRTRVRESGGAVPNHISKEEGPFNAEHCQTHLQHRDSGSSFVSMLYKRQLGVVPHFLAVAQLPSASLIPQFHGGVAPAAGPRQRPAPSCL